MCTVTWLREPAGYQLFCNRDEMSTRTPALGPKRFHRHGVQWVAPTDGDFGGSWIAINDRGLSLCLLNGRPACDVEPRCGRSRGLLLVDLIPCGSLAQLADRVGATDLSPYLPFTLLALAPAAEPVVIRWDGHRTTNARTGGHAGLLSSSSIDDDKARSLRTATLSGLRLGAAKLTSAHLLAFHRSHAPERGAFSACMHRAGAETVSFSWITAGEAEASLYYSAGPPCSSLAGASTSLAIRQSEIPWTCC